MQLLLRRVRNLEGEMAEKRDFDKVAATWDEEPRRVALANEVAAAIIKAVRPTEGMQALDFGCGTGLLTLALQPSVGTITGVDSSRGMLDVLERKISERGLSNVRTRFCDPESGERPEGPYNLIVSSMTLHHVAELGPLFRLFFELLLPGGLLCLADLEKEDGTFHEVPTGVAHLGFEPAHIKALLEREGFTGMNSTTVAVIPKKGAEYPVFLLTAQKP